VAAPEQDSAIIDLPPDIFSEFLFFGDLDLDLSTPALFQAPIVPAETETALALPAAPTAPAITDACSDSSFLSFLNHLKTR
jgi:hypothetical protein